MAREQETRRTARLLDLVWRIASAPREWTRKRLADHYEVSERQITKDLDLLRNGRHGLRFDIHHAREGYYFERVPRLPTVAFPFEEALALLLATRAGGELAGVDGAALAAAVGRLENLFPRDLRPVLRVEPSADDPTGRAARLAALERAVAGHTRVWIEYAAASRDGEVTQRAVDPYAVVPYGRGWHVVGHCHLRGAVRVFKIDRIRRLRPLDERFAPPADFDLDAYLSRAWGRMPGVAGPAEEVVLRFHPPAATFVAEERWHESQRAEPQPDGTLLFRVTVTVTPEFQHWVHHYGRRVEVLAPAHLRDWIAAEARAVAAQYA